MRFKKKLTDDELKSMKNRILEDIDSIDRLKQKVSRTGCREPELVDEFKVIETLENCSSYSKEKIISSPKSIATLTTKRINLLDFINNNNVKSIRELSNGLNRDYKNVYDDVKVLSKNNLLEIKTEGKRRIPILRTDKIIIEF